MNTILIVDDDICIRELVSAVLQNEGFITYEASDGRDALRQMTNASPDLCVIDLMMPGMDGFDLCRKLRQYGRLWKWRLVVMILVFVEVERSTKSAVLINH
nr:response regulator [Paenibacillus sp. FSL H7-0357]